MKILASNRMPGMGWFRIYGYGLTWKDLRSVPKIFSERHGYTKYLRIGPYLIKWLQP